MKHFEDIIFIRVRTYREIFQISISVPLKFKEMLIHAGR